MASFFNWQRFIGQGVTSPQAFSSSAMTYTFSPLHLETTTEIKDRGLAIEPIVGIREFRVDLDEEPTIYSFNGTPWPQRQPLYASCGHDLFGDHEVPDPGCSCGIYAWHENQTSDVNGKLYGEVYLWGDVLICQAGYRAEIAYPKSLTIRAVSTRSALRVRAGLELAYGVPVTIVDPVPPMEGTFNDFSTTDK